MPFLFFLALFIGIPIAEIALLIQIGGLIGVWATIAAVLATAIAGTFLIRHQGLQVISQAQKSLQEQKTPLDNVIHGVFLLLAGALLLTPGFITDLIGFLCLVPPLRLLVAHKIWARVKSSGRFTTHSFSTSGFHHEQSGSAQHDDVIEGEFTPVQPDEGAKPNANSPWAGKK